MAAVPVALAWTMPPDSCVESWRQTNREGIKERRNYFTLPVFSSMSRKL